MMPDPITLLFIVVCAIVFVGLLYVAGMRRP